MSQPDLAPMEQLLAFVDWEKRNSAPPAKAQHIGEWAYAEIVRLRQEKAERMNLTPVGRALFAHWIADVIPVLEGLLATEDFEDGGAHMRTLIDTARQMEAEARGLHQQPTHPAQSGL